MRAAIGDALGMDGAALVAAEGSDGGRAWNGRRTTRRRWRAASSAAPLSSMGELWLWGQDRLFFLEKALAGEAVQTP